MKSTNYWAHPACFFLSSGCDWPWTPSSMLSDVRNEWSYSFTFANVFMALHLSRGSVQSSFTVRMTNLFTSKSVTKTDTTLQRADFRLLHLQYKFRVYYLNSGLITWLQVLGCKTCFTDLCIVNQFSLYPELILANNASIDERAAVAIQWTGPAHDRIQ